MPRRFPLRPVRIPGSLDVTLRIPRPRDSGSSVSQGVSQGECVPDVEGLFWVTPAPLYESWSKGVPFVAALPSDGTDALVTDLTLTHPDYVYQFPDSNGMNVGVHAAQLRGNLCDCDDVVWSIDFAFTDEMADVSLIFSPTFFALGATLIMVVRNQSFDGFVTISATACGVTYGPITMTFQTPP